MASEHALCEHALCDHPSCAEVQKSGQRDWMWANPWCWTFLGLGLCLVAWSMVLVLEDMLAGIRVALVFLGVLTAGMGVRIRLGSASPAFLNGFAPHARGLITLGLAFLFVLIAAALTVFLVLRFFEINPTGWRLNGLMILWALVCPASVAAAVGCVRRAGNHSMSAAEEGAAILGLAALTAFCGCWALYNRASPDDWDSMRLFLSVVFVVALGAAPLVLVSQALRRLVVSVLIVLHFIGIGTAVVSAPPAPWLVQQMWGRIYQPYLEFMYLNNAYHFYAPEPGPASYLWFRMFYEDPQGKLWAHWRKIPDMNEEGWHNSSLALEYQRMLALTENVVPSDPTPSLYETNPIDGSTGYASWYARRLEHSRESLIVEPIVGIERPIADGLRVPYPFHLPVQQQYLKPNGSSLTLLSAYARHMCLEKHPEHPDWKIHSVKVYRVVHTIPEVGAFVNERMDPRDPANYRPYYMGEYSPQGDLLDARRLDANGQVVNPGDPFLFWLLPNLREPPNHLLKSPIKCWALRHAGDEDWIYTFDEREGRHLLAHERKVTR
jgi:hypothetical protein